MSRIIVKPGNVYSIPLGDGRFSYAQALESPEFAFFDLITEAELSAEDVVANPVMFRIWVHKSSVETWNKIGKTSIAEPLRKPEPRFKQDAISGELSIYMDFRETPATFEQAQGLECAAVWEAPHILSRISDHFAGQENIWVKSMRPNKNG